MFKKTAQLARDGFPYCLEAAVVAHHAGSEQPRYQFKISIAQSPISPLATFTTEPGLYGGSFWSFL